MNRVTSIDDLRLTLAVASQQSFIAAARQTGIPASSVSRAVARLEEALGVRLFQRTSRSVSLTDEGFRLVQRCLPLLDQLGEAMDDIADLSPRPSGRLRVTAPIVSGAGWIASALLAFGEQHPDVSIELSLSNAVVDLIEEGFDLAFRGGPVNGTELVARRVCSVPYALGASADFVRQKVGAEPVSAEQLELLEAVLGRPRTSWQFRREDGAVVEVRPAGRFFVNDLRVAVDAASRGLGIVRAPREMIEDAGLVEIPLHPDLGTPESRDIYAVYPTRRFVPRRVRLAIDWVLAAANNRSYGMEPVAGSGAASRKKTNAETPASKQAQPPTETTKGGPTRSAKAPATKAPSGPKPR
jgi:DNA-binding transcriptional LysR family regulator